MGILPVMKFQQTPGMSTLLKKEVDTEICRSVGTLLAGEVAARSLKMGQLVGKIAGTEQAPAGAKLGKLVAWNPTATDGSQIVQGVCLKDCEAAVGADLVGGVLYSRRLSVLNRAAILWPADATDAQKAAALDDIEERLGLIVRA
ncbi:head decoration protein [Rhizobium lusitanum]|uniref:Bacteriophage lambda head decoration protein D n=1 Tax=Rhizobium lusitanum TaxID=293958 RepID=A0A1C3WMS9_9HYPH|nr:head decoration protein [Rhizobium lusitanum]SCB41279.1 Bacteriophage lambda head decoration protein D [Rhizobium lusitanum]